MPTRREKRSHLTTKSQIDFIHDDLDESAKQFSSLRREIRLFFIAILVAVVGIGLAACSTVTASDLLNNDSPIVITKHPTPVPTATRVPNPTPQPIPVWVGITLEELKAFCRPVILLDTKGCFWIFPD